MSDQIKYTFYQNGNKEPFVLDQNGQILGPSPNTEGQYSLYDIDNGKYIYKGDLDLNTKPDPYLFTDLLKPISFKPYLTFSKSTIKPDQNNDAYLTSLIGNTKPEDLLSNYGIIYNPTTKTYSIGSGDQINPALLFGLASKIYSNFDDTDKFIGSADLHEFLKHPITYGNIYSESALSDVLNKRDRAIKALKSAQNYLSGRLGSGFQIPEQSKPEPEQDNIKTIEDLPREPIAGTPYTIGTSADIPVGSVDKSKWSPKALEDWVQYRNKPVYPTKTTEASGPNAGGISEPSESKTDSGTTDTKSSGSIDTDSNDMSIFNYLLADKSLQNERTANLSKKQDMGLIPMLMALYGMGKLM